MISPPTPASSQWRSVAGGVKPEARHRVPTEPAERPPETGPPLPPEASDLAHEQACRMLESAAPTVDQDLSSIEAVDQARAGDKAAFASIVEVYWDKLFRWLYQLTRDRHRAEDLTQETFLKALAALDSFRPGTNFRAWLFRIGHNSLVNMKRSDRRNVQALPDVPATDDGGPGRRLEDQEELAVVARAIAELPNDFRSALLLRVQEGLSFKEIATVLATTEETARWRVFKARQKLLKLLPADLTTDASGNA